MPLELRQLRWIIALLTLAAIPVVMVLVRGERWDDCANPQELRGIGATLGGDPAEFKPFYRRHVFQREEGDLHAGPNLDRFRYRVVRSDEPRYPLEQPTRFLRVPMDPESTIVRHFEDGGRSVPIHFSVAHFGGALRIAASLYVYDGEPVEALLPLQLRSAAAQLVRGRRPITLFQVHGFGLPSARSEVEQRQVAWLLSAWSAYQRVCRLGPVPGAE